MILLITVIFLLVSGGLIYVFKIEPTWILIKNIELTLPHLDKQFTDWKIVQITDIHVNPSMTEKRLERIVNLVNAQKPQIIAITGDFISSEPNFFKKILVNKLQNIFPNIDFSQYPQFEINYTQKIDYNKILTNTLSKLNPEYQTFAVLGNHDHFPFQHTPIVRNALKQSNIIELSNDVYSISKDNGNLNIAGVDDYLFRKTNLDLVLKKLPDQGANIILCHEPDFADISAATNKFDLQLSGHSHGGQVKIPFKGPPFLPPFAHKYYHGFYQVGNMIQYTSSGVGMVSPYLRFNSRPEITVITLKTP
jgi:predicted MPP superfamily phosphohydrolase